MKKQKNTLEDILTLGFLSFLGTGYSPKAPGTVGSLATIPLILGLHYVNISLFFLIILISFLTLVACIITEKIQKKRGLHDPGWIVIDEVIGMLITWCFLFPSIEVVDIALTFIFFRIFDIFKIWPATYFDQRVKHGCGTILDDVISGFYAGFACLLCKYLIAIYN
jgi:phosphatidylglycerophosphatase A